MKKSLSHCELPIYGLVQLMKITPVLCLLCPYIISLHKLDEKSRNLSWWFIAYICLYWLVTDPFIMLVFCHSQQNFFHQYTELSVVKDLKYFSGVYSQKMIHIFIDPHPKSSKHLLFNILILTILIKGFLFFEFFFIATPMDIFKYFMTFKYFPIQCITKYTKIGSFSNVNNIM